ncbi:MAG: hypothetical protein JWM85_196 [Acidimicrobiaceae bacterium]|nr:hypothetical protein [Acidimicrobiaceae bacterium]
MTDQPEPLTMYIVRHAHAVGRSKWRGDDRERPLDKLGRAQAAALALRLERSGATALLTSPALRCIQTLSPLAERLGLPLEQEAVLAEGHPGDEALEALRERAVATGNLVACTHGDVLASLLEAARARGTRFVDEPSWPKAGTWVFTLGPDGTSQARLIEAPSVLV